ncbi:MFS transporter [Actinorhabdospora filicis]|uniref:MFS transporter n=1 Tax=Actinorhabdospora filicis TaxID=1785913 RepID=A0A9W6SIV2_9ACTN|nr:MFS transporter [Actinorhabdospora filicis]GLZ75461.1 MFS transporter [Actinorhabdospora filicis]
MTLAPRLRALLPAPGAPRVFAVNQLVDSLGTGLWLTCSVVFFIKSVGLPETQVGTGIAVAGLAGFLAGPLFGHLGDRIGLRGLAVVLAAAQAVCMASFVLVRSFWPFLLVSVLFEFCRRGGSACRNALVAATVAPEQRVRTRAYLRSVLNVGFSVGTLVAGVVLTLDTRAAYVAVILGNAATFLAGTWFYLRVPAVTPRPKPPGAPKGGVWRDYPFLSLTLLIGLLSIDVSIFAVAMPVWILQYTDAPRALVAGIMLLNTIMAIALQVPATRRADSVTGAASLVRLAGLSSGAACLLFPLTLYVPTWTAVALLIAAAVLLTGAELWHSAGGFTISMDLAPEHALGAYQGVFGLSSALHSSVGPALVTALALVWGGPGWLVLAAFSAGLGLLARPLTAWALRKRPVELAA